MIRCFSDEVEAAVERAVEAHVRREVLGAMEGWEEEEEEEGAWAVVISIEILDHTPSGRPRVPERIVVDVSLRRDRREIAVVDICGSPFVSPGGSLRVEYDWAVV